MKRWLVMVLAVVALTGCGRSDAPRFHNVDLSGGTDFDGRFALVDPAGKTVTQDDYRGKVVVMFFGYTHCPDVCPTTLSEMHAALDLLGGDRQRVRVLFVTVDPQRDTPTLLAEYAPAFDPDFVGLHAADEAALAQLTKGLHVYYSKVPGKTPDSYTIDHTAGSYVFDGSGRLRLYVKSGQGPESIADDLRLLLRQ